MKKQFAALLTALSLLPTLALAQEYYTLPEIREQAKDGWHETTPTNTVGKRLWISTWRCTGKKLRRLSKSPTQAIV